MESLGRTSVSRLFSHIDWVIVLVLIPLMAAGLISMYSFDGESVFFSRQIAWIAFGLIGFFLVSLFDYRILKRTDVLVTLFSVAVFLLLLLLVFVDPVKGAQSWFNLGGFSFQPADPIKILMILILAKYFSRRHVEIANVRHILVSGAYAFILFFLIFIQPDFGSALIIFFIWFGMTVVSGISKKHLFLVFGLGIISFVLLWSFVFLPHQKERIRTFLNPLTDIQGAGYNAFQSTVAVGSGELLGKGVGYGTQSRLEFLPEYETDFVFAAFAEEWGFVGALLLLVFFGILIFRILQNAYRGAGNFEMLYGIGLSIFLISHIAIHIGMNIGLLPVTGLPLPFVSYGGSHLFTELIALGLLMSMRKENRAIHREEVKNEFLGF